MVEIDYSASKYPVPARYADGHNRYWRRLGAPGAWLTGAQRVAVAAETRNATQCELCEQRKAALSPYQVPGHHESVGDLSGSMVEVVHRIATDAGRLTKAWLDGLVENGLNLEEYVEIVGTIVHTFSIDEFCRGLGLPLHALPEPLEAAPSHYRPDNLVKEGAWVPMLPMSVESGPESDIWEGTLHGNVLRALSLVPDEVRPLVDLLDIHYIEYSQIADWKASPKGTLSRIQIELVAARVSGYNDCFY